MVSTVTAFEIAGNPEDVVVSSAGPDGAGKYQGYITRGEGHNFKLLLSSGFVFDMAQEAEDAMRRVIADIKKWVKAEFARLRPAKEANCDR